MNSMAKTENLARWPVEERMADGRWRVPRYAPGRSCCPDDPYTIGTLLDGVMAKGWFRT